MDINHPYLEEVQALVETFGPGLSVYPNEQVIPMTNYVYGQAPPEEYKNFRQEMVKRYSWAILNEEALELIAMHSPIVSWGSGNGYNEHLLEQMGATAVPFDIAPPQLKENSQSEGHWTTVFPAKSNDKIRDYPDHALMLCWPTLGASWPAEVLQGYREAGGQTLVYIGEPWGGCNADDDFFDEIDEHWEKVFTVMTPHWEGINDFLTIYVRK